LKKFDGGLTYKSDQKARCLVASPEMIDRKDYEQNLRRKISRFIDVSGTKKTIQITFVTTYGAKKNMYSSRVTNQVVLNDLFKELD